MVLNAMRYVVLSAAVALAGVATQAHADVMVQYTNQTMQQTGTGFGTILQTLSLQAQGSGTTEAGSVSYNYTTNQTVRTGDATNQSQAVSVSELQSIGVTQGQGGFFLVFNINEVDSEPDVTLQSLTVSLINSSGTIGMGTYTGPLTLTTLGQGQGQAGYLFRVTITPDQATTFFSESNNRIAVSANITGVSGGPENLYIVPVPEPSSVILTALGGVGLGVVALRRRAKTAA